MSLKKTSLRSPSKEKNKKRGASKIDSEMPEEYEEQRSMKTRMYPQPFNKKSKK